ncbi:uncharacterized protein VTP21DRAFT_3061 [Calcarisporiella thermophila]|uniref:uncharacterized protein n=1 Tax=Calcarisporiella thermophila TaxID=911321 RepID=UPI003743206C
MNSLATSENSDATIEIVHNDSLHPSSISSDVTLPLSPPGSPLSDLKAKFVRFHNLTLQGLRFNDRLVRNKSFRNPHIYAKLVEYVDELGSNFPPDIFDPHGFPQEAFAENIATAQKKKAEERALAQSQHRSHIDFVSMKPEAKDSSNIAEKSAGAKKRLSKWDVPAQAKRQQQ